MLGYQIENKLYGLGIRSRWPTKRKGSEINLGIYFSKRLSLKRFILNWTLEYYTIETILFFLENAELQHPMYIRAAIEKFGATEKSSVSRPDRRGKTLKDFFTIREKNHRKAAQQMKFRFAELSARKCLERFDRSKCPHRSRTSAS